MHNGKRLLLLILLLIMLCAGTGLADGALGTPRGASYEELSLSVDSKVADVLDWLIDYQNRDMAYALNAATDLAGYCIDIDSNESLFSNLTAGAAETDEVIRSYMLYTAVSLDQQPSPKLIATRWYRMLSAAQAKLTYFETHLRDMMTQYDAIRARILSGEYPIEKIDEMSGQLELIRQEAEATRIEAIAYIGGSVRGADGVPVTAMVNEAMLELNALPAENGLLLQTTNAEKMRAIQILGEFLTTWEARTISGKEKDEQDQPTILVANKSQFVFTFTAGQEKVNGIEVTVRTEDGRRSKTMLSKDGAAIFQLSDFYADSNRRISVLVSWKDPQNRFRRQNLGRLEIEGGSVYHVLPERDDGKPYLVGLLFEDLDMISYGGGMLLSPDPSEAREFSVNVEIEPKGQSGRFEMYYENIALADGSSGRMELISEAFSPSRRSFAVKRQWLNSSASNTQPHFVPESESTISLALTGVRDSTALMQDKMDEHIKVVPAFRFKRTDWIKGMFFENPSSRMLSDSFLGNLSYRIPDKVPIIGGAELSFPKPLNDYFWPDAKKWTIRIEADRTINVRFNLAANDPNKDDSGRLYASRGLRAMEERHKEDKKNMTSVGSLVNRGIADGFLAPEEKYYGSVSVSAAFFVGFMGEFSMKGSAADVTGIDMELSGQIGVMASLTGDFSYYPCALVSLNAGFIGRFMLVGYCGGALHLDGSWRFKSFTFSRVHGADATLRLELYFGFGIGVKGFCHFSARATGFAQVGVAITAAAGFKPTYKIGFDVTVRLEVMFIFSWSATIVRGQWEGEIGKPPKAAMTEGSAQTDGALNEPQPLEMLRYVQAGDLVYKFWVVDQGTEPKIMMQCTGFPETVFLDFNRDHLPLTHKNIYDYDIYYGPIPNRRYNESGEDEMEYGFAYIVTIGEWSGMSSAFESVSVTKEVFKGLHQCWDKRATTYLGVRGPTFNWNRTLYLNSDAILVNLTFMEDDTLNTSGTPPIQDIYAMGTILYESDETMRPTIVRIHAAPQYGSAESLKCLEPIGVRQGYELPQYAIRRKSCAQGVAQELRFLIGLNKNDGTTEVYEGSVEASGLNAQPGPFTKIESPGEMNWEALGDEILFEQPSSPANKTYTGVSIARAVQTVARADGAGTDKVLENYAVGLNADVSENPPKMDLPTGGLNYHVLKYVDRLGNFHEYLWWIEHYAEEHPEWGETWDRWRIRASMVDPELRAFSPVFTLVDDMNWAPHSVYYLADRNRLVLTNNMGAMVDIKIKPIPTLETIMPEYPAIAQGEKFNMYIRLRNESSIVLDTAQITLTATPVREDGKEDKREAVAFKGYNIDLRHPVESSVTHYDYMMQDGLVGVGAPVTAFKSELANLTFGAENPYVETGAHTIMRLADSEEWMNTGIGYTRQSNLNVDSVAAGAKPVTYFMPGNVATFLVPMEPLTQTQLKEWENTYTLSAVVDEIKFALSPDEDALRYVARLHTEVSPDGEFVDTYEFALADDLDTAVNLPQGVVGELLAMFDSNPGRSQIVCSGWERSSLNTARQDSVKASNRAYVLMEHNDFEIDARQFICDGETMVEVLLSNEALDIAPDTGVRLITQYQYVDEVWRDTGWSMPLNTVNLNSGFNRSLLLKMRDITGNRKYERLRIGIMPADTNDLLKVYDLNDYNNYAELVSYSNFLFIRQPQSLTVWEGEPACFECEVDGSEGPYSYQWVVCYPDNTIKAVASGKMKGKKAMLDLELIRSALADNGSAYSIEKTTLADDSLTFWCVVTDGKGFSVMSDKALLNVIKNPKDLPRTGDDANLALMIAVALACAAAIVLLVKQGKQIPGGVSKD